MALDVQVTDDALELQLSGPDAIWAVRRSLRIPISDITAARVVGREEAMAVIGWRLGGTWWPGRVKAGHFTVRGNPRERVFASVYRDDELLLVETGRRWPRYLVLQHPDRHDLAWYLGERLG